MKKVFPFLFLLFSLQSCDTLCSCDEPTPEPTTEDILACNKTYAGFWTANSNCTYDKVPYTLTFNESADCDSAVLYNFLNEGESITVYFNSMSLEIPEQILDDRYNVFGSGFLNGDTLKFTFSKSDRNINFSDVLCELKATKQ